MQTSPSVPVIYCRVKGEETQKQGRDRHEEEDERRRGGGGGRDRGESRGVGENEEEDFLRGQVKAQRAQRNMRVVTWLNKSLG